MYLECSAGCVSLQPFQAAPTDVFVPQLLLIGDSGVGKSCLLLRFAVRNLPCTTACHGSSCPRCWARLKPFCYAG